MKAEKKIRYGLHISQGWLVYGIDKGWGVGWMPGVVMRSVVLVWNRIKCALSGHDDILFHANVGPSVCPYCVTTLHHCTCGNEG
jgi:hypothetical protein